MKRLLIIVVCIMILTGCTSDSSISKSADKQKTIEAQTIDTRSPEKKFVEDELDKLIRSVTSLTDTAWDYNVMEPLNNYLIGQTADKDSVVFDLKLASDLLSIQHNKVSTYEVPSDLVFKEHVQTYLDKLFVDLAASVKARMDVIEVYKEAITDDKILTMTQEEFDNLLIPANTNIQIAAIDYKFVLENVE